MKKSINIPNETILSCINYCFEEQFTDVTETLGDYFSPLKDFPLPNQFSKVDRFVNYCIERIIDELEIEGSKERNKYDEFLRSGKSELFGLVFQQYYNHYLEIYKIKFNS